jgi:hypothetical protein
VKTLHISNLARKRVEQEDVMAPAQIRQRLLPVFALVAASVLVIAVRSNSRQEQAQKSTPAPERPTALVEKNERNRMESAAYTDDTLVKYQGDAGRLTLESKRLDQDVTRQVQDSCTVLSMFPEPPAVALLKKSILAIRGHIISKQAFLTDNESGVFTEYEVSVTEVIKSKAPIRPSDSIFVTRPGGSVRYGAHILSEAHSRYGSLEPGSDVLLFLDNGVTPGTYTLYQAILVNGQELTTSVVGPPDFRGMTLTQTLAELRAATRSNTQ